MLYGITFATGQATITPASDQVLNDVLAVLAANADWRLRIEGHTDNVGDKAANLKLSNAARRAVAALADAQGHRRVRVSAPRGSAIPSRWPTTPTKTAGRAIVASCSSSSNGVFASALIVSLSSW